MIVHLYKEESDNKLVMYCGEVSDMPERSAPYVNGLAAFVTYPDACKACRDRLVECGRLRGLE